jgi:RNA polymerase sigma factor (sigma-70 family)
VTAYLETLGIDECEALAQRITKGDRAAEAELVRAYCDCVFAMALTRTRDREAARELMDDVMMAVITALRHGTVRKGSRLGGFVHGTAVNIINGYFRARRRRPRTVSLNPDVFIADPNDEYERLDRRRVAMDALTMVDERDKQILRLILIDGLKPGEVAIRLRISPALVRQRKCRALRAITMFAAGESSGFKARRLLRS